MGSTDHSPEPGSDRQWWITDGPEYCIICEGSVHAEMITWCTACDQGVCAWCLNETESDKDMICPACTQERG